MTSLCYVSTNEIKIMKCLLFQLLAEALLEGLTPVKWSVCTALLRGVVKDAFIFIISIIICVLGVACLSTNDFQSAEEAFRYISLSMCRIVERICNSASWPRILT